MPFYLSDSLPTLRLTFPGGESNEYRMRQGCVEFRTSEGSWRLLEECDVEFHFVLHTEVGNWLRKNSTGETQFGAALGKS